MTTNDETGSTRARLRGEIVWMFAYDVAAEIDLDAAARALAGRSTYRAAGRYRRAPETVRIYSPLVLELSEREIATPGSTAPVRPCARSPSRCGCAST
jgi:hypothetical protein